MSLNPDIRDQAYQFFIEEAQELLQVLESGLLDLRQDHSTPKVHELMRAAHSIKGGAASVELSAIELLAHRLEDFFKALYSDEVEFDAELEGLLLQGYDCLARPLTEQIEAGSYDESAALVTAEPVFTALEERLSNALKNADSYIPSSNDLGVDIVASIFEVDVVQALEHLKSVLAEVECYDPAAELTNTLDMFAGFAELFNLPGFSEIVQTSQQALAQNPHLVEAIIQATLSDCTQAQELVLAGDRLQGGSVSPELAALAEPQSEANSQLDTDNPSFFPEDSGLELDSLWSAMPTAEAPAEDIFATFSEPAEAETEHQELSLDPESSTLDSESLWSEMPSAEASEEDIFATFSEPAAEEAETEHQELSLDPEASTLDSESLWSEMPAAEAPSDDIFASETAENTEPDLSPPTESVADIDEIFGIAAPESEADENLWSSPPPSEPLAADIFDPLTESTQLEESQISSQAPPESEQEAAAPTAEQDEISQILDELTDAPAAITPPDEAPSSPVEEPPAPENLKQAIASIEDIFPDLPQASQAPQPEESSEVKPAPATSKAASSSKPAKSPAKLSVRVDLERLERMNNLVGELTINRNSLSLQNSQLQNNVSELGQKFLRFREVTRKLREISDQLLLERRSSLETTLPERQQNPDVSGTAEEAVEFDSLEMDSYNTLYASLQNVVEEIVQLEESVDDITIFAQQSDRTINSQRQMLEQMRDELMWVRMLPLNKILQRFPRTLRELSTKYNKPVELQLSGTGVLVDKAVLEKLSDPLLHLLRNGFDHGIEDPEIRAQQGKPATGSIAINAYHQGNQTVIEVKDDGQGLNIAKIKQKALEKGLISPGEADAATPGQIFDLIFEPGFSTASKVSELSGRGVGMNIVRSQIETLKGKISVNSSYGKGCTFTMRLPLTLTIAKLLVCSLGSTAFAIPSDSIEEIIIPTEEVIKWSQEQKFLNFNGSLVPIFSLKSILGYNCPVVEQHTTTFKTIAPPADWLAPLLLLRRGQELFALEIVSLLSEQELVIKPYGGAIKPPAYSYGCTILGDGSLIPAFDGAALLATILGEDINAQVSYSSTAAEFSLSTAESPQVEQGEEPKSQTAVKTIMVVDDSTALRRTMALTLEKAGYRVIQHKDGRDALTGFKQNPHLDLIICDVEMPVMNGFEFLGMRRRDSALSKVPTFMLTSRSGAKHRNLAKQLGADGYFTKPYVEQDFLGEVNQILTQNQQAIAPKVEKRVQTKTILVIDDSSALRRTLSLSLEHRGYRVIQGRDGLEGLQQLRDNLQTDLVICDIEMPNLNGFEFLTSRRQEPSLNNVPVVMLTSRSSEKHRALANSLGAADFFTKPYVEEQFISEIEKYL
ncbi:MAG: hybrid sensor histidine kinase/response regulator [Cyanobacteria bacterium J06621_8]